VRASALVLALCALACRSREGHAHREASPPPTPADTAPLDDDARRFLDVPGARRAALVAALVNPDNEYSRTRAAHYGFESTGWDALPAWNPRTAPVTADVARALAAGDAPALDPSTTPLWNAQRPRTRDAWIALGRRVFFEYPMRAESYAEFALRHPEVLRESGLDADAEGTFTGLRVFRDVEGSVRVGITCALCHTSVRDGRVVEGAARRTFDYGRLRLTVHARTGAPLDPLLASRMAKWGPGRADVTGDESEDPVAIPDLWGLGDQSYFTQAGTLRSAGVITLAVRQETQLVETGHQRTRPPRELAWALATYLVSLTPPPLATPPHDATTLARGRALFEEHCAACHSNASGGGDTVTVAEVGTDPALATGSARGTGRYRPATLVRARDAAPYLHDGTVATLDDLFDPARLTPAWTRGVHGPGPVRGHPFGVSWPLADRRALVAWLDTR
jgi:mono/diheme cytochrome c family protein